MSITLDQIQENLKNNRIYLDPINSNITYTTYPTNTSIFNDILLKNLLNKNQNGYENKKEVGNNVLNQNEIKFQNNKNNDKVKFKKNSFIEEIIHCLYERAVLQDYSIKEFKNLFLAYINNSENKEYFKTLSRSYKKLQFRINDLLVVDNIDEHIGDFPEFIILLCKFFNINILFLYKDIYKLFEIDADSNNKVYLVFDKIIVKHRDNNKKIYKFREEKENIDEILNNKNKYYNEKDLNKMKLDDLNKIKIALEKNGLRIGENKKGDLIEKFIKIYSVFD